MPTLDASLHRLGLQLPTTPQPLANYLPAVAVHSGTTAYVSGQLPLKDGKLIATGSVPREVSPEQATECARQCVLNAIAALATTIPDLDRVRGVARIAGYVNAEPGFAEHPAIINGASDLIVELLGDAGKHARAAIGVASLPMNAPVEIEVTFIVD